MPWPRAPLRYSAKSTARRSASLRWARWARRSAATFRPIRSSFAAARMSAAPAISACSRLSARVRSPRACAVWRRSPALRPRPMSPRKRARCAIRRRRCAPAPANCRPVLRGFSTKTAGSNANWPKRGARLRPGRDLRSLADDLKRRIGSGIVAIVSRAEGKAAIVVGVTPDLTDRFNAVELVRAGAAALGGKGGGGRPDMAQAGGPDIEQAEAALAAVERGLAGRVGGGPAID